MKNSKKEVKEEKEKKVVKKKKSKKENKGQIKKELIIGIVIGIVLILVLVLVFVLGGNEEKDNNDKKDNNEQVENKDDNENVEVDYGVSDESTIIRLYGMSKEDALNIVKTNFNSDNFEFSVEISSSVTYIVTAKNTVTNSLYKYEVNPATKAWYEI